MGICWRGLTRPGPKTASMRAQRLQHVHVEFDVWRRVMLEALYIG
jgi:hypothetical protein